MTRLFVYTDPAVATSKVCNLRQSVSVTSLHLIYILHLSFFCVVIYKIYLLLTLIYSGDFRHRREGCRKGKNGLYLLLFVQLIDCVCLLRMLLMI